MSLLNNLTLDYDITLLYSACRVYLEFSIFHVHWFLETHIQDAVQQKKKKLCSFSPKLARDMYKMNIVKCVPGWFVL